MDPVATFTLQVGLAHTTEIALSRGVHPPQLRALLLLRRDHAQSSHHLGPRIPPASVNSTNSKEATQKQLSSQQISHKEENQFEKDVNHHQTETLRHGAHFPEAAVLLQKRGKASQARPEKLPPR